MSLEKKGTKKECIECVNKQKLIEDMEEMIEKVIILLKKNMELERENSDYKEVIMEIIKRNTEFQINIIEILKNNR
jgi:hypothetical protein